ncbi:hypothetical protein E2542_SST20170 [Spatholobus suberectus]|nr:hypothetical protein E2542_SST20170 [Spatholobus suberectus]
MRKLLVLNYLLTFYYSLDCVGKRKCQDANYESQFKLNSTWATSSFGRLSMVLRCSNDAAVSSSHSKTLKPPRSVILCGNLVNIAQPLQLSFSKLRNPSMFPGNLLRLTQSEISRNFSL